jgi:general secretion pathway protein H
LRSRPSASGGFTLIEIMVVLVIIGVLATAVSLSIGSRSTDDRMDAEARRLMQLIRFAADEAQAKGLELGLRHTEQGFDFVGLESAGGWSLFNEGALRPRTLPQPFYLELHVEGQLIPPAPSEVAARSKDKDQESEDDGKKKYKKKDEEEEDDADALKPQVLMFSSGEMSAFTLDLKLPKHPAFLRIEGDALGQLKLTRFEDETQAQRKPRKKS